MPTLKALKESAKDSAEWRGHCLGRFKTLEPLKAAEAICKNCGMAVIIDAKPGPNGITVHGRAVALNCTE